jgi:transcriptional regulator with XRE-family HTH domain
MSLSKKLRELLFERNITPAKLAKHTGVPMPTVHRMVTGKTRRPNEKSLEAISDFFGISATDLTNSKVDLIGTHNSSLKKIPVLEWKQLDVKLENRRSNKFVVVDSVSDNAFALEMLDHSMEPFVEKGSLLILDPEVQPIDRSYCLIKIHEPEIFVFRQILIDIDRIFIRSINKDLDDKNMRILNDEDVILAKLIEMRVKVE